MPRTRTTKGLAKRIALDFFERKSPLRRLRSRLVWGAGILAALVGLALVTPLARPWSSPEGRPATIGGGSIYGSVAALAEDAFSPGALSEPHAMLENDCAACHDSTKSGVLLAKVSGETCTVCHDGPIHRETGRFTPPCASCHVEHRGRRPARVRDAACVACHADIEKALVDASARTVEPHVTRFTPGDGGHPELAALTRPDPGSVRLNHKAHLALGADWLARQGMKRLECGSCHAPDGGQRLMEPVSFERHCASCHRLEFDAGSRFAAVAPGPIAPHDTPRSVHVFLVRTFTEEIARRPGRLTEPDPLARPAESRGTGQLLGRTPPPPPPRSAEEWVAREVAGAERILFHKDCALCHELSWPDGDEPGALPEIAPARVPERWLPRARFDHRSHRLLACEACHDRARTSTASADVLLPALADCTGCHRPGRARDDCALCHDYHDKERERPIRGVLTLPARAMGPSTRASDPPGN